MFVFKETNKEQLEEKSIYWFPAHIQLQLRIQPAIDEFSQNSLFSQLFIRENMFIVESGVLGLVHCQECMSRIK